MTDAEAKRQLEHELTLSHPLMVGHAAIRHALTAIADRAKLVDPEKWLDAAETVEAARRHMEGED